ncbi:hypothetical protein Q9966_016641 [Columba livia]|nr:hypothetical protein Q9966_016641 [Columba livia]KAK2511425.1 hypothetical protein Q9966_016641 [Columba livia]
MSPRCPHVHQGSRRVTRTLWVFGAGGVTAPQCPGCPQYSGCPQCPGCPRCPKVRGVPRRSGVSPMSSGCPQCPSGVQEGEQDVAGAPGGVQDPRSPMSKVSPMSWGVPNVPRSEVSPMSWGVPNVPGVSPMSSGCPQCPSGVQEGEQDVAGAPGGGSGPQVPNALGVPDVLGVPNVPRSEVSLMSLGCPQCPGVSPMSLGGPGG